MCYYVVLFDFAGGSLRWELIRVPKIFGELLFELAYGLVMLFD